MVNSKIFVNLPVKNLDKSMEFFSALGYSYNPQFTDDKAACMVISEDIYVMLLREEFFKSFTLKEIADSTTCSNHIVSLSVDSKDDVDSICEKALSAGGKEISQAVDMGFMYQWGFQDLDGHHWEYFWMDPDHIEK